MLEGRGDGDEHRQRSVARRRKQVARILRLANPALQPSDANARASVIVYLLKGEDSVAQEDPTAARRAVAELRRLVSHCVTEALRAP